MAISATQPSAVRRQVAGHQSDREGVGGVKGPIPGAKHHGDAAERGVHDREIEIAVAVQFTGRNRGWAGKVGPGWKINRQRKGSAARAKENADRVIIEIGRDDVQFTIAIHVARRQMPRLIADGIIRIAGAAGGDEVAGLHIGGDQADRAANPTHQDGRHHGH